MFIINEVMRMTDFEHATPEALARGYDEQGGAFVCLHCGKAFERGEVFEIGGRFFEAERAARLHVESEHPNRFDELLNSNGKYLSLTDRQKELFALFYGGFSDTQIAKKLGVSASTVRHQKFVFRERAKAARLYLAVWSMAEKNLSGQARFLPVHKGATMVDDRYNITEEEYNKILGNVFISLEPLKLKVFSPKEKKKIAALRKISEQFEPGRQYTEKEVNAILEGIYPDYATLRRYLVEYGFMARTRDCSAYWRK